MLRRVVFLAAGAVLWALPSPAPAQQQVGTQVIVTYSTLGLSQPVHGGVVAVATDATNRVWAVTPGRVSAALGSARAALFPFDVADTALPAAAGTVATAFSGVTFAVPTGNAADGEHFYLGSSHGIAWGRLAANLDSRGALLFDAANLVSRDQVNAVASDGSAWLWAATEGGLVLWDLSAADPAAQDTFLDGSGEGAVGAVAVSPWGAAAASDGTHLHLLDTAGADALGYSLPAGAGFRGLAFDAAGSLWAATTWEISGHPQILKFAVNGSGDGVATVPQQFPLNPFVGRTAPVGSFAPTAIAVDPFTGRVWVTAAVDGVAYKEAFFQEPNSSGDLQTAAAANAWGTVTSTFDRHTTVHADSSGNAWLGMAGASASSEALNGYVVRQLTLDKSRYLGSDAGAVSLTDLALTGSGTLTLTLAVGSDSRDFPFSYTAGGSGAFAQTFQIVPGDGGGGSGSLFQVGSTADDVAVTATYTFTDANGVDRQLTAAASWANIVAFEDDAWIGGPCFLDTLGK